LALVIIIVRRKIKGIWQEPWKMHFKQLGKVLRVDNLGSKGIFQAHFLTFSLQSVNDDTTICETVIFLSRSREFFTMNTIITTRGILGVALAVVVAGGGVAFVLPELGALDQGKKPTTVRDLLIDQKPRQISYISFPIAGRFAEQLESSPKIIRFPGERPWHPRRERTLQR
jgi:hypothetical protein